MKTVLIACKTIEDEVETALKQLSIDDFDILWTESEMHNTPHGLGKQIQGLLDGLSGVDRVLLGYGLCGDAAIGLQAGDFSITIPKVDDCITLMLGSQQLRRKTSPDGCMYFLSKGWLRSKSGIYHEYQYAISKYGKDLADKILHAMLSQYKYLGIIDSEVPGFEETLFEGERVAEIFDLKAKTVEGGLGYISQLLTGPWPSDRFVTVQPGETINRSMFL